MDQLASIAEMVSNDSSTTSILKQQQQQQQPQQPQKLQQEPEQSSRASPMPSSLPTPPRLQKRINSDNYLSADEHIDVRHLLAARDKYIFPRDDQLNYICVFQGCNNPILRGMCTEEYFSHLQEHSVRSDHLLSNMLRCVPAEYDKRKRRRANSTNTYDSELIPSKKCKDIDSAFEREDLSPPLSPRDSLTPVGIRKRAYSSDEYNIPLKPSSRGVQLRDQMLRYGLHLFRIDSEGKYICFFDECSLHMMTNFSRHIAKHEKNGDKIKQELLHLCSPTIIQQQLQQHPSLHLSAHITTHAPSPTPGPLQQLLFRHQQETIQLQQNHQQQLIQQSQTPNPQVLDQSQIMHAMQYQQLQIQHKQQLQALNRTLAVSPVHSLHPQLAQQHPNYPQKPNISELGLISQIQSESELALMRSQLNKMLEEASRMKQRSHSIAYSSSPIQFKSPSPPHHTQFIVSPPDQHHNNTNSSNNNNNNSNNNLVFGGPLPGESIHPQALMPHQKRQQLQVPKPPSPARDSNSHVVSTPSPPPSEIQWIFPKTKPVLSK